MPTRWTYGATWPCNIKHDGEVSQGVFSADGRAVATAHHWGATVWPIAPPATAVPLDPRLWVECLTHATLHEDSGKLQWLADEEVETRKARLNQLAAVPATHNR